MEKGKVLKKFWTKHSKEISKKLLYYTETDFADLDSSYWNSSLKKLGLKSWFHSEDAYNEGDELSEDLLAIVNFFVAKNNGRRASEKKKKNELELLIEEKKRLEDTPDEEEYTRSPKVLKMCKKCC